MSPFEQAQAIYRREPCQRLFTEDLFSHLQRGFVFTTPEFFIMGRGVVKGAPQSDIVNPSVIFRREDWDCWMIYLMAGDMAKAWGILPWPLKWFAFERKNELRFYPADQIARLSRRDKPIPDLAPVRLPL